jgi:hypothetical protein
MGRYDQSRLSENSPCLTSGYSAQDHDHAQHNQNVDVRGELTQAFHKELARLDDGWLVR